MNKLKFIFLSAFLCIPAFSKPQIKKISFSCPFFENIIFRKDQNFQMILEIKQNKLIKVIPTRIDEELKSSMSNTFDNWVFSGSGSIVINIEIKLAPEHDLYRVEYFPPNKIRIIQPERTPPAHLFAEPERNSNS